MEVCVSFNDNEQILSLSPGSRVINLKQQILLLFDIQQDIVFFHDDTQTLLFNELDYLINLFMDYHIKRVPIKLKVLTDIQNIKFQWDYPACSIMSNKNVEGNYIYGFYEARQRDQFTEEMLKSQLLEERLSIEAAYQLYHINGFENHKINQNALKTYYKQTVSKDDSVFVYMYPQLENVEYADIQDSQYDFDSSYITKEMIEFSKNQFSPVCSAFADVESFKHFDLTLLNRSFQQEVIQQQLVRQLQSIKDSFQTNINHYTPLIKLPYQSEENLIYPKIKVLFSVSKQLLGKDYIVQLEVSPYYNPDELLCILMQNIQQQDKLSGFVLKLQYRDVFFIGHRILFDYDCIREALREQQQIVLQLYPFNFNLIQTSKEFLFDEDRLPTYNLGHLRGLSIDQLYPTYINCDAFKQFCRTLHDQFKDNPVFIFNQCIFYDEEIDESEFNMRLAPYDERESAISTYFLEDYLNISIRNIRIPIEMVKLVLLRTDFDYDINEYRNKYFPLFGQEKDKEWIELKEEFDFPRLKSFLTIKEQDAKDPSTSIKTEINKEYLQIYQNFQNMAILISSSITYGPRQLSCTLFSQLISSGQLEMVDQYIVQIQSKQHFIYPILFRDIPLGAKLAFNIYMVDLRFFSEKFVEDKSIIKQLLQRKIESIPFSSLSSKLQNHLKEIPKLKTNDLLAAKVAPIASQFFDIFDGNRYINGGRKLLRLWPGVLIQQLRTHAFSTENMAKDAITAQIHVRSCNFYKIYIPKVVQLQFQQKLMAPMQEDIIYTEDEIAEIIDDYQLADTNSYSAEKLRKLYEKRFIILNYPNLLPIIIHSIPLHKFEQGLEFKLMIDMLQGKTMPTETVMELLDFEFPDVYLRQTAIKKISEQMRPIELKIFVLQLVQCLKFEIVPDLFRLLLKKTVDYFEIFGYRFYWMLRNEMRHSLGNYVVFKEFMLLILRFIDDSDRQNILVTEQVMDQLIHCTKVVYNLKHQNSGTGLDSKQVAMMQTTYLTNELKNLNKAINLAGIKNFKLPLHYHTKCDSITVEKCKIMSSKKAPIMLFLHKYESEYCANLSDIISDQYVIMSKCGDDLRQDALTIQIMEVMNDIWLTGNMNLKMRIYALIPTGPEEGFLEIITKSQTLAKITSSDSGAAGAFKKTPLAQWLFKTNTVEQFIHQLQDLKNDERESLLLDPKNVSSVQKLLEILDNFLKSCAGFAVATYILGIGDRHNDNVMLSENGCFFHIDFGHFLGNFKSKFGIKRETAPFFFTPDMKYVMDVLTSVSLRDNYQLFMDLASDAYCMIRDQGTLIIVLMKMLVNTGIAELQDISDLKWLTQTIYMYIPEDEARKLFQSKITEAVTNLMLRINNAIHIIAHK